MAALATTTLTKGHHELRPEARRREDDVMFRGACVGRHLPQAKDDS